MNHHLLKPASLLVLFLFLSYVFLLIFYDGYRAIYFKANMLWTPGSEASYSAVVEEGRKLVYGEFFVELDNLNDRSTMDGSANARHKFRWFYKSLEGSVYQFIAALPFQKSMNFALYARYLHYSLWALLSLVFIHLNVSLLSGRKNFSSLLMTAITFLAIISLLISMPRFYDQHSFIAMGCVSAGIFFGLKKQILPFLFVLAVATANRESGAALGIIFALLNWREKYFWVPLFVGPVIFFTLNYDLFLFREFYQMNNFVVSGEMGYVNAYNLNKAPTLTLIFEFYKYVILLAPLFISYWLVRKKPFAFKLLAISLFYIFILLFVGVEIGVYLSYAVIIPVLFSLIALYWQTPDYSMPRSRQNPKIFG